MLLSALSVGLASCIEASLATRKVAGRSICTVHGLASCKSQVRPTGRPLKLTDKFAVSVPD
jgi:hypothetical protein